MSELKVFQLTVGKNLETDSPLVVGVDNKWNSRVMSGEEVYIKSEVDEAIAELRAKLESVQASAYADSVDAGMRERRLRRALWLARANNAINSYDKWNLFANFESEDKLFTIDEYDETPVVTDFSALRTYAEWCKVWQNVARKCLKKAEEWR